MIRDEIIKNLKANFESLNPSIFLYMRTPILKPNSSIFLYGDTNFGNVPVNCYCPDIARNISGTFPNRPIRIKDIFD